MTDLVFSTERLHVRPFQHADFDLLRALHSDPEVNRYLSPGALPMLDAEVSRRLEKYVEDHRRYGVSKWKVETLSGAFVGRAGFGWLDEPKGYEIGYCLKREAWGRGYASEIARGLIGWFFRNNPQGYLHAFAAQTHASSLKVMAKAGMSYWKDLDMDGVPCSFYRIEREDFERLTVA